MLTVRQDTKWDAVCCGRWQAERGLECRTSPSDTNCRWHILHAHASISCKWTVHPSLHAKQWVDMLISDRLVTEWGPSWLDPQKVLVQKLPWKRASGIRPRHLGIENNTRTWTDTNPLEPLYPQPVPKWGVAASLRPLHFPTGLNNLVNSPVHRLINNT